VLQWTGFGLAVAVLIDATLVRSVVVPAAMRLLGRRNRYLSGSSPSPTTTGRAAARGGSG
jgi:RND superfamily putative drug exporter